MLHTVPVRERSLLRSHVVSVAIAAIFSMSINAPVVGQGNCDARASLAVGRAHGVPGQTVQVGIIGRSACETNGFAMAVGHDASRIEFVRVDPGDFLVDHAGRDLFVLSDFDNARGFMTLFAAFDITGPITVLPRSVPSHTELMKLTYRIKFGAIRGTTQLRNENRKYGSPPISHVFTTQRLEIHPSLISGSITIQAFSVNAGDDQVLPERSFTTLVGSASGFRFGATPAYRWTQTSGPLTQKIGGGGGSTLTVQLPQVTGDQTVVFELDVDDGQDTSKDTIEILVQDADARGGELRKTSTPSNLDLPPSAQAIAFVGQLEWGTDFEDGIWSRVRFQVNSHAVLDEIARLTLYMDENQSGDVDGGDRLLGSVSSPFAGGQTSTSFVLNERLRAGAPVQFLLIAERSPPAPARQGSFPIWPALAVLAAALVLTRAGVDLGLSVRAERRVGWAGLALSLALLVPACSSGGGGGDGGGGGSPAGVVFSIDDESDIDLRGETTRLAGNISGLPLQGPELNVD